MFPYQWMAILIDWAGDGLAYTPHNHAAEIQMAYQLVKTLVDSLPILRHCDSFLVGSIRYAVESAKKALRRRIYASETKLLKRQLHSVSIVQEKCNYGINTKNFLTSATSDGLLKCVFGMTGKRQGIDRGFRILKSSSLIRQR